MVSNVTEDGGPTFPNNTAGLQASSGGIPFSEVWFDNVVVTQLDNPTSTPTSTPIPVTKVVFAPGFGASWNADAILNCKTSGYSGDWTLAPYAKGVYQPLLDSLSSNGWNTIPFFYDWRKRVSENGINISNLINSNTIPNEKVNLVGHSMGGLVERAYLESQGNSKTDSYYSAGSPHKGVAMSYPAWSGGDIWNDNLLANIATTLLLHRCPNFYQNPRITIQSVIPSIQNILPIFDYLKSFQTGHLKPISSMLAQNNWLPRDESLTFNGVRTGTLSGTGLQTLKYIRFRNPSGNDISNGNWLDGRPVAQEKINEGDGTVLLESSQLGIADINDVINQNHSGLVASTEGISKILTFIGTPIVRIFRFVSTALALTPVNNSIYVEPKSALVIVGYPGNFWVKDPNNNISQSENGVISFMNPIGGNYELQLIPQTNDTLVIVSQFLSNGQTLYKEYHFKGTVPKTEVFRFDPKHPTEDILRDKRDYKDFRFPWWRHFWKFSNKFHN